MDRYTAIFGLIASGWLVSLGLRDIFPSTQHRDARYLSCILILIMVFLGDCINDDHVSSVGFALKFLPVGLGVVVGDLLALAMMQSNASSHPDECIGTGQVASQHSGPTFPTPQKSESHSDSTAHSSSTEGIKRDLQDQQVNHHDFSVADTHRSGDASKTAKPKQPVDEDTQSKHNYNEWVIKGAAPNKNLPYAARARPNKRLKDAFHVSNCFTEGSQRCLTFRKQVENMLQPKNQKKHWHDWPELLEVAKTNASSALSASANEVNLFDAIHLTVMKIRVLFGKSFEGTSKDHLVLKLARGVNEQWIESKKRVAPGETPGWEFERQGSLKAVAEEIFPEWDGDDIENPFNRILPGYETMWRVVLRSVLEIASTRHPAATTKAWKERLASFIQNPTRNQLQNQTNEAGLTVEHLSFEVLRLYPPTRHVARMHTDQIGHGERVLIADIELLHHTAPVWGR